MVSLKQKVKTPSIPYNYPVKGKGFNNNLEGKKKAFVIEDELNQKTEYFKITYFGFPQPKIDKCSITYPITSKKTQKHIEQFCKGLQKDFKLIELYQHGYWLLINGSVIRIHFKPKHQKNYFIRVEWNPTKIIGFEYDLKILINQLIFNFDSGKVKVTRLDVALDYPFLKPRHIKGKSEKTKKYRQYFDSAGMLETIYFGSRKSQKQFVIYNKTKQLEKCGFFVAKPQTMRIEARLRDMTFSQLKQINPFASLQLFHAQGTQNIDSLTICEWWLPEKILPKFLDKLQEITQFFDGI